MYNWKLVIDAAKFAQSAHAYHNQVRKYSGEPYFVHCEEVANLLVENIPDLPEEVRAAAYLHDVVEDVPEVTSGVIEILFGGNVRKLVDDVTDVSKPEDGNRAKRKSIDRSHLARSSHWGATIKYADLISNTRDITKQDKDFAMVYLKEKKLLLQEMTHGDKGMRKLAIDTLEGAWKEIYGEPYIEL